MVPMIRSYAVKTYRRLIRVIAMRPYRIGWLFNLIHMHFSAISSSPLGHPYDTNREGDRECLHLCLKISI